MAANRTNYLENLVLMWSAVFKLTKFQQLSTIQGLICIVSDVGVPELVSAFRIIKGPHLRGES